MSFYVYETQAKPKCERCRVNPQMDDHEVCEPCLNEMILPGFRASFLPDDEMRKEIRRSNGFE
ncbi:hypothetical protein HMPREF9372_3386 [Sporosarcina newyorkensis 2681]|uniref:Uncharacterized protein n=1 Tax=Sporosarcina newyorkensis 2681 TaxID=1027292 RepID=F9DX55_9BACL|nr:hypothetical protein [Sporosarcina newyorkensis]EGQ21103.1 hypothetical protein HMPREF9372_3386 [Sporosarcina newyorkensis 2681]